MKYVIRTQEIRRSRACRAFAVTLSMTLAFGSLRVAYSASPVPAKAELPDDRPWAFSGRLRPSALKRMDGPPSGDQLWSLFDSDAKTGLDGKTTVAFEVQFEEPVAVTSIGAFGASLGHLTVKSAQGAVLAEKDVDSPGGPPPHWDRLPLSDEAAGTGQKRLLVSWVGKDAGSHLPELELWGRGRGGRDTSVTDVDRALPAGASLSVAKEPSRRVSAAAAPTERTFDVAMNVDPRSIDRAFLVYRVEGVRAPSQIARSLNGAPALSGPVVVKPEQAIVEEISPRALKTGSNVILFHPPTASDPVGYRVREVAVAWIRESAMAAAAADPGMADGRESTAWNSQKAAAQSFTFDVPAQPHELEFRLVRESSGSLSVTEAGGSRAQVDLSGLRAGWHRVKLDALPVLTDLRVTAAAKAESPVIVSEMHVTGSPPPASTSPGLRLLEPQRGECVDHRVNLRVLSSPSAVGLSANGHALKDLRSEGDAVEATFADDLVGTPGKASVFELAASYPTGGVRKLQVHLEACMDRVRLADAKPRPDSGAPFKTLVSASKGGLVSFKEVTLEIPPDALDADTEITVRPLAQGEYHGLDAGMINATAGNQAFRLGPHNLKFKKPVRLTLPIDPTRVQPGEDLETFYFDETERRWREIPKSGSSGRELASMTTHFTDFIASTLAIPAHPGVQSLNPTSIKDMKLSDPLAGVEMIAPPTPNSQGTASLSYPIIVPPGRKGMQPKLAITYNSDAKNGTMGIGWSLPIPTIEIDTRFGVPKYQGEERYLMNGQELSRMTTGTPSGAPAGTYFVLRNESTFNWIQRINISGGGYYWLVSDKAGTKYTYGQSVGARLQPNKANGSADPARAARWFLEKEEDMWGNQVVYSYVALPASHTYGAISGESNTGDPYYQIYPSSISYTLTTHGSSPAPQYAVKFGYVSTARPDAFTDGRFGFLVYTDKLLDYVDVMNGSAVVRRYKLAYKGAGVSDFGKSLLDTIQVFGKGTSNQPTANAIATHIFSYHSLPRPGANQYQLWSPPFEGQANDPAAPFFSFSASDGPTTDVFPTPNLTTGLSNEAHHSKGGGTHGIAGPLSVGVGKTVTATHTGPGFVDMDGDGLLDFMPNAPDHYASPQTVINVADTRKTRLNYGSRPQWSIPMTEENARVMNGSFSLGAAGGSVSSSQSYGNNSESSAILRDVNGDGFPDFVQTVDRAKADPILKPFVSSYAANSLAVQLGANGSLGPVTEWKGFDHQQLGFTCGQIFTQTSSSPTRTPYDFPTVDPITRWTAPYAGRVRIGGAVQLTETGGDGIVATLFKANQKIWERDFQGTDTTACIPAAASPEPGSGCSASPTIVKTVAKGDRFYTRVNGKATTEHDNVFWAPTFEYIDAPASEATAREAWGAYRYKFAQDADSKAISADYVPWIAPEPGRIKITMTVDKQETSAFLTRLIGTIVPRATGQPQPLFGGGSEPLFYGGDIFTETYEAASIDVQAGDLLYIGMIQSMPYDPERFVGSALVTYSSLTRRHPGTGATVSGPPICVPRSPELGADSPTSCTVANDPDPSHPADGEALSQYAPIQMTQRRWKLKPPISPAPTPDGRKAVFSPTANPTVQICGDFGYDPVALEGGGVIGVVQGVNKVFTTTSSVHGQTCVTETPGIAAGEQVVFAVYSFDNPNLGPSNFTASINGQATPVEVYTVDSSFAPDTNFLSLGQTDKMSGGMNNFSEGFWNGNFDFDEAYIVAGENDRYQRATIVNYPTSMANVTGARVQWGLSSIGHLVSKAAKAVVNEAKKVVMSTGTVIWKGIKWIGGVASKFTAWSICQSSDIVGKLGGPNFIGSYTVNGVSYAETRTSTDSVMVGPVTGSSGHSQTNAGLDLIDMNGDGLADDVTPGGIRYATVNTTTGGVSFAPFPSLTSLPKSKTNPSLRQVESNMYSTELSTSVSKSSGNNTPQVGSDSSGETIGMSGSVGVSFSVGKGYARTQRQLADMNGDGLPDIIESDPNNQASNFRVFLNYGYGFGNPVNWNKATWGKNPTGPDFNSLGVVYTQTLTDALAWINGRGASITSPDGVLQLDQVVNAGEGIGTQFSVQAGYVSYEGGHMVGTDGNYVMTFTRIADVNGDGLPDQVYKSPASTSAENDFWVKINTGTGFDPTLIQVPTTAWPTSFFAPLNSWDAISYRRNSDVSLSGHTGAAVIGFGGGFEASMATGGGSVPLDLTDFDGDGLPDHVAKVTFVPGSIAAANQARASEVLVRYNQAGKSNLLKQVTNGIGGGFTLDYSREGNVLQTVTTGRTWRFDMPTARYCLSSITTFDNLNHSYTDVVQYDPLFDAEGGPRRSFLSSGFYDRTEKAFYGFSHVRVIHGDGSQHLFFYQNDTYCAQGTLLGEYESTEAPYLIPMRGSIDATQFAQVSNTSPQACYISRVDHYAENIHIATGGVFGSNTPALNGPDSIAYQQTTRIFDSAGNLVTQGDLGDNQVATDDVWFRMTYQTFPNTHFNPVQTVTAADAVTGGTTLRQRDAIYTTVNGRPTLSQITDTILGGNQPTSGAPYSGSNLKTTYGFALDTSTGDFGNLRTYTDPSGATMTYGYDSTGTYVTSVTDNLGQTSGSTINMDFGVPQTTTDENGQKITFGYDAFGRTVDVWGPTDVTTGTATVHVDYSQGNVGGIPAWAVTKNKDVQSTTNDPIELVTFIDGLGRILQTKKEAEVSADGSDGTTQVMLVSGQVLYDSRGRPITENDPVAIPFDPARRTTFEAIAPTNTITYAYDAIGRLLLKTWPTGNFEQHIYVPTKPGWTYYPESPLVGGRMLEVHGSVDGIGAVTWFYQDATGRQVGITESSYFGGVWENPFTYYQYDRFGNVGMVYDANQNVTSAVYDSHNRLVSLTSPDAGMTEYRYGTNGLLMQKQTAKLRSNGSWINYAYDPNTTRLKTIDYPSMPDVSFTYGNTTTDKGNAGGNLTGRIKQVTMEAGTEQRRYDAFGNISQTTTTLSHINNASLPSPVAVMKYTYDWMGRMQSMTFPNLPTAWSIPSGDGEVVSYVYDKGGNLKQITGKLTPTSSPETYLSARTYNNLGQLAVDVAGNGVVTTRSYHPARHWLTGIATATSPTAAPFQNTVFGRRGGDGMVLNVTSTAPALAPDGQLVGTGTTTTTYDYDSLRELTSTTSTYRGHATYGYTAQSTFIYDKVGNVVGKAQTDWKQEFLDAGSTTPKQMPSPMPSTTYTLGFTYTGGKPHAANLITETKFDSTVVTHTVTHDGSGNNTGETAGPSTRALVWDEADRLKQVDVDGTTKSRFRYNADGERTQRQDVGGATTFYFNQFLVIHGNQYVTKHIFGGTDRLVSKTEAASGLMTPLRHFYHSDQVGSTSYITDASKTLVQHERYFPFGERWADPDNEERSATNTVNGIGGTIYPRNWLFTSKELDADTGYYYYGARYYDARTARWLSPDPILASYMQGGPSGGIFKPRNLGLYTYAWNIPVMVRDPTGLCAATGTNGACNGGHDPQVEERQAAAAAAAAAQAAAVAAQQARYQAWYNSLTPSQRAAVDRANAGGAAAARNAAFERASLNAQVGGQALIAAAQVATVAATAAVAEAVFPVSTAAAESGEGVATGSELSVEQTANLARFEKRLPSGATPTSVHDLPGGGKAFQSEVPGHVPGSKAIYEKQVSASGETLQFTKTTVDPAGRIVHTKNKLSGEVILPP